MEKIRKIIILITVLLLLNCKKELNKTVIQETKEIVLIKKKENLKKLSCTDILGKWHFINNNSSQDFHLELKKVEAKIIGEHCFIKGTQAENIDCSTDPSISLTCNGTIAKGEIESAYADDLIKVQFDLLAKDTLKLKTLNDIGFSFFYDGMLFIKNKN